MEQGCELVRIALKKHVIPVTRIVAIALKLLKRSNPGLKLVVSFSDPEQGHYGGIYQGGGWIFSGYSQASDEYIFKGKRWQGRSFRNTHKGLERDPRVKIVKGSSKLRYLMPLDEGVSRMVTKFSKKYPKRAGSKAVVAPPNHGGEGGSTPTPALQNAII